MDQAAESHEEIPVEETDANARNSRMLQFVCLVVSWRGFYRLQGLICMLLDAVG